MGITNVNSAASLFANVGGKEKTAEASTGFAELLTAASGQPTAPAKKESAASMTKSVDKPSAQQEFMDYMNKTPAERWQEAWLRAHGMTKEEFDALPADKKAALVDEMKQEMQEQMRQAAENNKDGHSVPALGML